MTKIRRGGYIFLTWVGDHGPRHVHVFKDDKPVCKFNLEDWVVMKGGTTRRILDIITELNDEGRLFEEELEKNASDKATRKDEKKPTN